MLPCHLEVVLSTGETVAKKVSRKGGRSESRRFGTLVRLDDEVVADAKVVASLEGVSMAELLSEILRPILKKRASVEFKKRFEKDKS